MAIPIKNAEQVSKMRKANRIVALAHELIEKSIRVGMSTNELDKIASDFIISQGAKSNFKGYNGYPKTICSSINEVVIHGIPDGTKLKSGDIISVDMGAVIDGYHGDAARTYFVGDVSDEAQRLAEVAKQSFFEGIKYAKSGNHLHEISAAIQDYVERNGFSVVREYVGHGIGKVMHEPPQIPNYKSKNAGRGPKILPGMTFAIEPMVNVGTYEVELLKDGWTVVTKDRKLSAHYENTILITDAEPDILTIL